ncbi:MAG: response regulator [Pseudomonadota bacterium]
MSQPYRILVVDDNAINIELITHAIQQHYALDVAMSGQACLEYLADNRPDLILMDVDMPGLSGYETCRLLKNTPTSHDIPVMFVSAYDSVEERIAGYEAGGVDYIGKPFFPEELQRKIHLLIDHIAQRQALLAEATDARSTAMTALTSTGELGGVLNFFRACFTTRDPERLAGNIIETMHDYGLKCSVQIRGRQGAITQGESGAILNPLEIELHEKLSATGKIVDFGPRTLISFGEVSLLIKNMPITDADRYGRIKDNAALIVEGAHACVRGMRAEATVGEQQDALRRLLDDTTIALQHMKQLQTAQKEQSLGIMDELTRNVEKSLHFLALNEQQEFTLLSAIDAASKKSLALHDAGDALEDEMELLIRNIQSALKN